MENKLKISQLYNLNQLPHCSSLGASLPALTILFYLFHHFNFYITNTINFYLKLSPFLKGYTIELLITPSLNPLCYSSVILISSCIILTVFYNEDKFEGFQYILGWIGIRIFPALRILIEINVIIPAYFMLIDNFSIILLILAIVLNLFVTFFMQNYSIRKDYMCCKDIEYLMTFKILIFIGYILNFIGNYYLSSNIFMCLLIIHLLMSFILWILYFFKGIMIYRHSITRNFLIFNLNVYLSLTSAELFDEICRRISLYMDQFDWIYFLVIFCISCTLSYNLFIYLREKSIGDQQINIKRKIYFINDKLQNLSVNPEDECSIRGIIKYHIDIDCKNIDCFCKCNTIYDFKRNKFCTLTKINQNKSIFIKFYLKCLHQLDLEKNNTLSKRIDYTEFMYFKFKNTYKAYHLIHKIENQFLFPYDRIRIIRLKKVIFTDNKRLNKQLYDGKLDIEFVVACQKRFENLKFELMEVLKRNLIFWQSIHKNKINLTELIEIIKPNFKSIDKINDNWKELAVYFEVQKKWKFYFTWYSLYIKNQKLKPVILQYFGTEVHEDQLYNQDSDQLSKGNQKIQLYNSKLIFDNNSAVIHTNSDAEKPQIKRVNNYFTRLFGYSEAEVIQSSINLLMTKSIGKFHPRIFLNWTSIGRSNSQYNYSTKKVYCKHKNGQIFNCYKYIKQLINNSNELEYVALFKSVKQNQMMMVLDQNYLVEGVTNNLSQKLGFINMKQFNINLLNFVLICPKFIKYTKYCGLMNFEDENFFGVDKEKTKSRDLGQKNQLEKIPQKEENYSNFSLNIQIKENGQENQMKNQTKRINQSTTHHKISLRIPDNVTQMLQFYEKETLSAQNTNAEKYKTLKRAYLFNKNCKSITKFNCEIDCIEKIYQNVKYYEVYFRDITCFETKNEEMVVVEKKKKKISTFVPEDFHKFFQSSQDNRAYSLNFTNNIFIKQDNNKPVKQLSHIGGLMLFLRLFFFSFVIIMLVTFLLNAYFNFITYNSNGDMLLAIQNLHLKVIYFTNKLYDVSFYNNNQLDPTLNNSPQYYNNLNATIYQIYSSLEALKVNPNIIYTIFDDSINTPSNYYSSNISNKNFYDEVDMIFQSIQTVENIMFLGPENYNINTTNANFLKQFLIPSFNQLCLTSENSITSLFKNTDNYIVKVTIIIYVIQALAIALGFILTSRNTSKITSSFISIMEVFTQFSQTDIIKIYKYCHFLTKIFKHLNMKDNQLKLEAKQKKISDQDEKDQKMGQSVLSFVDNYYDIENNNININKKIKKIEIGTLLNRLRIMTFFYFILFLIIFAGSGFYLNSFVNSNRQKITNLANLGQNFFVYFTTLTKVQLAIKMNYVNSTEYSNSYAQYFANEILAIKNLQNINSRIDVSNSFQFSQIYNNMFFSDACSIYKDVLNNDPIQISLCRSVSQNSLQHGIQSYIYYFTSTALDYLSSPNVTITTLKINDLQLGLYYVNIFLEYLAQSWYTEFSDIIYQSQYTLTIYSICILSCYVIVYIVLVEILVMGNLRKHYNFFKKVYEMYMPDFLVTKEKIIKAKLIVDGILNK